MNRTLGNVALNMAMDPHRPPDWLSNNAHTEGPPEGTSRSQSVPPVNPSAARLNQTSGHLRPGGSESVINQGQPNGFTQQGVGPNGETWRVTVNPVTGAWPPNLGPFEIPHLNDPHHTMHQQHPYIPRPVPPPMAFQHPAAPVATIPPLPPNNIPGTASFVPLGRIPEYQGPRHTVESMQYHTHVLMSLFRRVPDHAPTDVSEGLDAQLQEITRMRNRAQRVVNDILVLGRGLYQPGFDLLEVEMLRRQNVQFSSLHTQVQQAIRALRPGYGSDTTSNEAGHPGTESRNQTGPTMTYVLHGPDGPRAVVFSPQGTFADQATVENRPINPSAHSQPSFGATTQTANGAQPQPVRSNNGVMTDEEIDRSINEANTSMETIEREINSANENLNRVHNQMMQQNLSSGPSSSAPNNQGRDSQQQQQQALAQQPNGPEREQAAEAQAEQDAQAVMRVVGPFFRHVWLLIRIGGFIWFLTRGGAASRRTLFLCVGSLVYFAIQAGFMRDQIAWVRRHFENLMGVHGGDEGERGQEAQQGQQQQNGAARVPAINEAPPERQQEGQTANPNHGAEATRAPGTNAAGDAAENTQQDRGALRYRFTSLERAVALFFASLYPGVGERQVAARARRAREAAEDEIRGNREREQQEAQQRPQHQPADRPHEHQD